MCSNYRPVTSSDRLLSFFGVERERDEPSVDVWPLGLAPFIRLAEDGSGNKIVDDGLYGLLPQFAAEMAYGRRTYNARSETVAKLASFRESWAKGWRCIIPAEAIYEPCWETGKSVRWVIRCPAAIPMGIAGIYRKWRHPDGREMFSFSMLTVNADGHWADQAPGHARGGTQGAHPSAGAGEGANQGACGARVPCGEEFVQAQEGPPRRPATRGWSRTARRCSACSAWPIW